MNNEKTSHKAVMSNPTPTPCINVTVKTDNTFKQLAEDIKWLNSELQSINLTQKIVDGLRDVILRLVQVDRTIISYSEYCVTSRTEQTICLGLDFPEAYRGFTTALRARNMNQLIIEVEHLINTPSASIMNPSRETIIRQFTFELREQNKSIEQQITKALTSSEEFDQSCSLTLVEKY